MKVTAYKTEFGPERIYASEHQKERNDLTGGDPLGGFIAWSLDAPGQRKKMKHVCRGGTPHFVYVSKADADTQGGESLDHLLFKEAVSEIGHTRLILNGGDAFPIVITAASLEEKVRHPSGNNYRVDVYLKFESEYFYGEKWSGEIYFEVCHKHPVPTSKILDLKDLELPVIECKLNKRFFYRYDESSTTRAREKLHKDMIKKTLESEAGFIPAKILNDPSSPAYLKRELDKHIAELGRARQLLEKQHAGLQGQHNQLQVLQSDFNRLGLEKEKHIREIQSLEQKNSGLSTELVAKERSLSILRKKVKRWTIVAIVTIILLAATIAILLKHRADEAPTIPLPTTTEPQQIPAAPSTPSITQKHAPSQKHHH